MEFEKEVKNGREKTKKEIHTFEGCAGSRVKVSTLWRIIQSSTL
jgi:hypothetical protein